MEVHPCHHFCNNLAPLGHPFFPVLECVVKVLVATYTKYPTLFQFLGERDNIKLLCTANTQCQLEMRKTKRAVDCPTHLHQRIRSLLGTRIRRDASPHVPPNRHEASQQINAHSIFDRRASVALCVLHRKPESNARSQWSLCGCGKSLRPLGFGGRGLVPGLSQRLVPNEHSAHSSNPYPCKSK